MFEFFSQAGKVGDDCCRWNISDIDDVELVPAL